MRYAGILAGGVGARMGYDKPKQFLPIGGIPAIIRTVRTFLSSSFVDKLVVAIHPDWQEYFKDLLTKYGIDANEILLTTGGETRFLSMCKLVERAIEDLGFNLSDDDYLLVHDCARVFVSKKIIEDNFALALKYDMVTTSMPTIDTVILSDPSHQYELSVPDRDTVYLDQGPQTFRITDYQRIRSTLSQEQEKMYMEAGRMYREAGFNVGIVPGDRLNFKLTTPLDIEMAEFFIQKGIIK